MIQDPSALPSSTDVWHQGGACRHLSADSLESVPGEPEAPPGLQQLAGVLAVQLQVVNGADDLSVHVPDARARTSRVRGERG